MQFWAAVPWCLRAVSCFRSSSGTRLIWHLESQVRVQPAEHESSCECYQFPERASLSFTRLHRLIFLDFGLLRCLVIWPWLYYLIFTKCCTIAAHEDGECNDIFELDHFPGISMLSEKCMGKIFFSFISINVYSFILKVCHKNIHLMPTSQLKFGPSPSPPSPSPP